MSAFKPAPSKLQQKLAVLADAAKYDASCSSSGTAKRNSVGGKGIGSTEGSGICHSYAPDGRCISLLKILFANFCLYDCLYCVNRVLIGLLGLLVLVAGGYLYLLFFYPV